MQKLKKVLVVTLATLMLVPTGVNIKAKPLNEVVTNCELGQEEVVQLGVESLSGDLLGVIRIEISKIKNLTFLQGIDMKSLGLVPNTGVILKLNTDDAKILEKVRKGIEEFNKKYLAGLNLDEFFVKENTTKVIIKKFESHPNKKENLKTLPEVKEEEKNKEPKEEKEEPQEKSPLEKAADFKLDEAVTKEIKEMFEEMAKSPLEKAADFKMDPEVTKEISETLKKIIEDTQTSREEYEKIKEALEKLDPPSIGEIGKIFEDAEKREEEDKKHEEELNKILNFKLNEKIVNEIADIFKKNKTDKEKQEEELEKILNFKLNETIVNEIADIFKKNKLQEKQEEAEKEAEKKETEFLDKISDFKFQKDEFNYAKMFFDKDSTRNESFVTGKGFNHTAFREEFLKLVNEERTSKGLNALTLDETLEKGTDIRSKELAEWGHIRAGENFDKKHSRLNGDSFRTAFDYLPDYEATKAGYLGENLLAYTMVPEKEDYKLNTDEGPID